MTPQTIRAVTGCSEAIAALYAPFMDEAMSKAHINTPMRQSAFLAQLAHESGSFRWMQELWGPTAAQRRYERDFSRPWPGPADNHRLDRFTANRLAYTLGNSDQGDGYRFKGRGPIQVTGRSNYTEFGAWSGYPAMEFPELLADPRIGFLAAAWYWLTRGCNVIADSGDFVTLTKRINGGTNGLEDRERLYALATAELINDNGRAQA